MNNKKFYESKKLKKEKTNDKKTKFSKKFNSKPAIP